MLNFTTYVIVQYKPPYFPCEQHKCHVYVPPLANKLQELWHSIKVAMQMKDGDTLWRV